MAGNAIASGPIPEWLCYIGGYVTVQLAAKA